MFAKECIRCERLFNCKGKEKDKPCLCFEERKDLKDGNKQQTKGRKI